MCGNGHSNKVLHNKPSGFKAVLIYYQLTDTVLFIITTHSHSSIISIARLKMTRSGPNIVPTSQCYTFPKTLSCFCFCFIGMCNHSSDYTIAACATQVSHCKWWWAVLCDVVLFDCEIKTNWETFEGCRAVVCFCTRDVVSASWSRVLIENWIFIPGSLRRPTEDPFIYMWKKGQMGCSVWNRPNKYR